MYKWIWLIFAIVAFVTLFYWFGIRPVSIKKYCRTRAWEQIEKRNAGNLNDEINACLGEHGF